MPRCSTPTTEGFSLQPAPIRYLFQEILVKIQDATHALPPDRGTMSEKKYEIAEKTMKTLEGQIRLTARRKRLMTYNEFVNGVEFWVTELHDGRPFFIDGWTEERRGLLGEVLSQLATASFHEHGFLCTAVVVNKNKGRPSRAFFKLAKDLGMSGSEGDLWAQQRDLTFDHYAPPKPES